MGRTAKARHRRQRRQRLRRSIEWFHVTIGGTLVLLPPSMRPFRRVIEKHLSHPLEEQP